VAVRIVMSACPSVCPHVSARLPLGGFSWNLIRGTLTKICWEGPKSAKIGQLKWRLSTFIFSVERGSKAIDYGQNLKHVLLSSEKLLSDFSCRSVRPSLCPHISTRPSLDEFSWNLILVTFLKRYREMTRLVQIGLKFLACCVKTQAC